MTRPVPVAPGPGQESVWDYPRPPRAEPDGRLVVVVLAGQEVCRTRRAVRVLETSHPPTWYLPRDDWADGALRPTGCSSYCEWKGAAAYLDVVVRRPDGQEQVAPRAAWTYPDPVPAFDVLRDTVAVYPAAVDRCTVDGEQVRPQVGGFYGGWVTDDVVGPFKGSPGSTGW